MTIKYYPWVAFIFVISLTAGVAAAGTGPDERWKTEKALIEQDFGVSVAFDRIEFPPYWDAWTPRWVSVPVPERLQALQRLRHDLSHYDPGFLQQHLKRIFLVYALSFKGQPYGGTNDHRYKWLYLQHYWLGSDSVRKKTMGFHHELSSILLKTYITRFDEHAWRNANVPQFEYTFARSLETNIQTGRTSLTGNEALYRQGFLCPYGTLTLEDDINTFAQYLIGGTDLMSGKLDHYPRMVEKIKLLTTFYLKIGYADGNRDLMTR
jgi:hypothetical protein